MSDLDPAQVIGIVLLILIALTATLATMSDQRRRDRQAAMRRHPSSRTSTPEGLLAQRTPDFTSDRAVKYHTSNEWGH